MEVFLLGLVINRYSPLLYNASRKSDVLCLDTFRRSILNKSPQIADVLFSLILSKYLKMFLHVTPVFCIHKYIPHPSCFNFHGYPLNHQLQLSYIRLVCISSHCPHTGPHPLPCCWFNWYKEAQNRQYGNQYLSLDLTMSQIRLLNWI